MLDYLEPLFYGISACYYWFAAIVSKIPGSLDLWLGLFTIFCVYRFLLSPLIGGVAPSSDKVKRSSSNKNLGSSNNKALPKGD